MRQDLNLNLSFEGTEYFWGTNNTSFLQMWVEAKCNGMHFTRNHLVVLMAPTVLIKMLSLF